MAALAILVGFLGPFGTYTDHSLIYRVQEWGALLFGAYILVRPCIWGLHHVALRTSLPVGVLTFWGVVATSLPIAMIWRSVGQDAYRELDGYAELIPFALLCALAVIGVTIWARVVSERFADRSHAISNSVASSGHSSPGSNYDDVSERSFEARAARMIGPRLHGRLGADFRGPIIALQSEDHYVRVHSAGGSELVLMRLRDAIAEMDHVEGEQVHRSWWIARDGVAGLVRAGRTWSVRLTNGELAPVARESANRLQRSGFLRDVADEVT